MHKMRVAKKLVLTLEQLKRLQAAMVVNSDSTR